jgi:hypothetical protein
MTSPKVDFSTGDMGIFAPAVTISTYAEAGAGIWR